MFINSSRTFLILFFIFYNFRANYYCANEFPWAKWFKCLKKCLSCIFKDTAETVIVKQPAIKYYFHEACVYPFVE